MYDDAGDARNTASAAISSSRPGRAHGMPCSASMFVLAKASSCSRVPPSSEGKVPGAMPFTRMGARLSERSVASSFVRCEVAALRATYAN